MKRFAFFILLFCLFFSGIADAKYSDEYRAKYPRRVKVETKLEANGKKATKITYTLFKHSLIGGRPLRLIVRDSGGLIKICSITYGDTTESPGTYTAFSWGDGEYAHNLKTFLSFTDRVGRERYSHFITAQPTGLDLKEMKDAIAFSVEGGGNISTPLLDKSHKKWKEWQEAVEAAENLMNEI